MAEQHQGEEPITARDFQLRVLLQAEGENIRARRAVRGPGCHGRAGQGPEPRGGVGGKLGFPAGWRHRVPEEGRRVDCGAFLPDVGADRLHKSRPAESRKT